MQCINHWPDKTELSLPEPLSQDLYYRLLEPFDSEASVKEFWKEAPSTLIILGPLDSIEGSEAWRQIEFILRENFKLLLITVHSLIQSTTNTYPIAP